MTAPATPYAMIARIDRMARQARNGPAHRHGDYPCPLSRDQVRALLDGRKTQLRKLEAKPWMYRRAGDRLWMREALVWTEHGLAYEADGCLVPNVPPHLRTCLEPVVHGAQMPQWAARPWLLKISRATTQRVQDITEDDALAEGLVYRIVRVAQGEVPLWKNYLPGASPAQGFLTARESFRTLWDAMHAKNGNGWDENPRVCAFTFRLVSA